MDELTEAGVSGTCIVKFIVSKNERVSDVEAVTMKGSKLSEVAVNAIRKGPNWIPAQQNGREVNAYRLQPVTFKIDD
ncbi:MAG: energy transducer TonB [Chitinophagaceae bacterium]